MLTGEEENTGQMMKSLVKGLNCWKLDQLRKLVWFVESLSGLAEIKEFSVFAGKINREERVD